MARIRCFMIEPTERVHRVLEVRSCGCEQCMARYGELVKCAAAEDGRHRGTHDLGELPEPMMPFDQDTGHYEPALASISLDDESQPWPTCCDACKQDIPVQQRLRGVCGSRIWRNSETGEEYEGPHRAPPGAMYRAPWLRHYCTSQDEGAPLCVMTPGGGWIVDSQASNCTIPDDQHQDKHHCWIRTGAPPDVDVSKAGETCGAGAGSIQAGSFHGFLRNGWLEG